ncbi:MAG: hypothetical protein WAW11_02415 [Patescibacteria group bacterium]
MQLTFKIDRQYDKEMILEFMPKKSRKYKENLSDLLRIDSEDLNKLLKNNNAKLDKVLEIAIADKYKKLLPFLKNSVYDYQKSWNKINNSFSKLVEIKTGYSWKYKKYYCVVSAYHEGISSWGKNIIARRWSINADTQRKVTAHELVLSHFWTMLEDNKISKNWSDDKKWQYSEIFAWCLLGLDEDFYKFWPWLLKEHLFPENHEYPDIIPLQNKLKKLYFRYKNFPDFFEKAINLDK